MHVSKMINDMNSFINGEPYKVIYTYMNTYTNTYIYIPICLYNIIRLGIHYIYTLYDYILTNDDL